MRAQLAASALFLTFLSPAAAQQTVGSPPPAQAAPPAIPDPPFDVYIHTPSENGRAEIVVRYHADHTYTETIRPAGGYLFGGVAAEVTLERDMWAGRWWIDGRKFCWRRERPPNPNTICKDNGHYIGRTPISGYVQQSGQ